MLDIWIEVVGGRGESHRAILSELVNRSSEYSYVPAVVQGPMPNRHCCNERDGFPFENRKELVLTQADGLETVPSSRINQRKASSAKPFACKVSIFAKDHEVPRLEPPF